MPTVDASALQQIGVYVRDAGAIASAFNELKVVERTPVIELKSVYGVSALRDITTLTGSAQITNTAGEYRLALTADAADSATLDSAERGRYQAGYSANAGIGIRIPVAPVGTQDAKWGYFDNSNGFGYGVDAAGLYVFTRRATNDTKVYQSSWNTDKLDGTGSSGYDIDLSSGSIFQIEFTWYGYGVIEFSVVTTSIRGQVPVVVHRSFPTAQTSVADPNLPVRAYADNGSTATAFDLYVAGRQFSMRGKFDPNRRSTGQYRLSLGSVGATFLPTVSLRRKAAFVTVAAKLSGFDILTTEDLVLQIRQNASLTGASYATPSDHAATETAMEADISATAVSGGQVLWEGLVDAAGAGAAASGSASREFDLEIPSTQPVTLCVRTVSGTGTVSAVLRVREEW